MYVCLGEGTVCRLFIDIMSVKDIQEGRVISGYLS